MTARPVRRTLRKATGVPPKNLLVSRVLMTPPMSRATALLPRAPSDCVVVLIVLYTTSTVRLPANGPPLGQANGVLLTALPGRVPPLATQKNPVPLRLRRAPTKLTTLAGRRLPPVSLTLRAMRETTTRVSRMPARFLRESPFRSPLAKNVGPSSPLTLRHSVLAHISSLRVRSWPVIRWVTPVMAMERRKAFRVLLERCCSIFRDAPDSLTSIMLEARPKSCLIRHTSGHVRRRTTVPMRKRQHTLVLSPRPLLSRMSRRVQQTVIDVTVIVVVACITRDCAATLSSAKTVMTFVISRTTTNLHRHAIVVVYSRTATVRVKNVAWELMNIWTKTGVT